MLNETITLLSSNTENALVAGGLMTCILYLFLLSSCMFGLLQPFSCNCCNTLMGQCNSVDCGDSCLVLTARYICLKYCPCCTRDYTRKLRKQVEKEEKRMQMLEEQEENDDNDNNSNEEDKKTSVNK